jgi:hypothetical protein
MRNIFGVNSVCHYGIFVRNQTDDRLLSLGRYFVRKLEVVQKPEKVQASDWRKEDLLQLLDMNISRSGPCSAVKHLHLSHKTAFAIANFADPNSCLLRPAFSVHCTTIGVVHRSVSFCCTFIGFTGTTLLVTPCGLRIYQKGSMATCRSVAQNAGLSSLSKACSTSAPTADSSVQALLPSRRHGRQSTARAIVLENRSSYVGKALRLPNTLSKGEVEQKGQGLQVRAAKKKEKERSLVLTATLTAEEGKEEEVRELCKALVEHFRPMVSDVRGLLDR